MNKDWVGNKNSIYKTLGASNHTSEEREENDYYATDPIAAKYLIELENLDNYILEPACGEGHLAQIFREFGFNVVANDLIDRGYGNVQDFFEVGSWKGDIVTNPPYSIAEEFVRHSLNVISTGNKVCMFLKLQFLEGKKRKELFKEFPPVRIWVSSSRIKCAKNGKFDEISSSAVAYAWFVWEKGFNGETILKWFN